MALLRLPHSHASWLHHMQPHRAATSQAAHLTHQMPCRRPQHEVEATRRQPVRFRPEQRCHDLADDHQVRQHGGAADISADLACDSLHQACSGTMLMAALLMWQSCWLSVLKWCQAEALHGLRRCIGQSWSSEWSPRAAGFAGAARRRTPALPVCPSLGFC